jgi:hypothetical protein
MSLKAGLWADGLDPAITLPNTTGHRNKLVTFHMQLADSTIQNIPKYTLVDTRC